MQKITTVTELKSVIYELEFKQANEWPLLKEQFLTTYEGLKPLNVIKDTFREFASSPDFKENLIDTTMGVTAGYLSQALMVGASHNPIKKLLGAFLQMGISNVVAKNPETIKSLAGSIINFFKKNDQRKIENN